MIDNRPFKGSPYFGALTTDDIGRFTAWVTATNSWEARRRFMFADCFLGPWERLIRRQQLKVALDQLTADSRVRSMLYRKMNVAGDLRIDNPFVIICVFMILGLVGISGNRVTLPSDIMAPSIKFPAGHGTPKGPQNGLKRPFFSIKRRRRYFFCLRPPKLLLGTG